jgi:hypothetical protein
VKLGNSWGITLRSNVMCYITAGTRSTCNHILQKRDKKVSILEERYLNFRSWTNVYLKFQHGVSEIRLWEKRLHEVPRGAIECTMLYYGKKRVYEVSTWDQCVHDFSLSELRGAWNITLRISGKWSLTLYQALFTRRSFWKKGVYKFHSETKRCVKFHPEAKLWMKLHSDTKTFIKVFFLRRRVSWTFILRWKNMGN